MACFSRGVILFLLAVLLCTDAALDLEERQKEEEARQAVKNHGRADAAGDKPDPPPDLTLVPSGPSIMLVMWGESSSADVDHYYVYVEDEDMNDTTTRTHNFYMWEGLEDCTIYTFGVKTVLSSGVMSDPALADGETDAGYPPEPQGLRVGNYTYNAVTLVWEKPATLCDIVQYRVTYQNNGSLPKDTLVDETTVEVSQLKPETLYTFSVSAYTSLGQGPAASITQTTMAVPGPPQDLVAEGVSSSAINVSWSPPVVTPENYYVSVEIAGIYEKRVFDTQYLVENLKPCKTYEIIVSSYYIETGESFPAKVLGETKGDLPSAPTDCSVQAYKSYISVTWQKPSSYCALGPYSVDWTVKKLWGDGEEKSYNETIIGLSHSIFDPPPYHSYTFEIAASVDGIFGDSTSCSGNSLDTNPGPPVLVSVVAEAKGELRVTWEPPVEENGQIIEYGIFVDSSTNFMKNVSGEVHTTTVILKECVSVSLSVAARNHADKDDGWGQRSEEKEVIPPGDVLPDSVECYNSARYVQACWLPYNKYCPVSQYNLQWEGKVLWSPGTTDSNSTTLDWSSEKFCYNISSIPYTNYRVSLSVGTNTEKSVTCSSTSPMAAPGPPTLEEIQAENLTINVTWKEPQQKNGIISNYRVEWTDWDGNTDSKVTDGSTYSYQIMLNSCGGEVDVIVSAKTSDVEGFGERSQPGRAFLVNSISHLSCNAIAPDEVALSWELQDSKCSVDYYNVTWSFNSLWSDDKGSGFLSVNGNDLSTTVGNLIPYSEISVAVHVSNSPQAEDCSTITQEETSGPPTNLHQTANDSNSATVEWSEPKEVRGKLHRWHLTWKTKDHDENIGEANVTREITTYQITGLSSSGTYVVSVMAVNGAGEGEPSTMDVITAYVPKETPLGLILGVSIGGGVVLILLAVGGFVFYKKTHQIKQPRPAPFMPDIIDSDNDKLYKRQHQSSANQRLQGEGETIDFGTNRELYPDNTMDTDPPNVTQDGTGDHQSIIVPEITGKVVLQPQVTAFDRRPSQMVNIGMKNFEKYSGRSSQPVISAANERNRRPSHHVLQDRPNLGEFGRRPSQQVDLGRHNPKEFGRRPSQQVDLGRHNPKEFGRRPSQQTEVVRHNMNEFGRRSSQQINERPRPIDQRRRFSQQIEPGRSRLEQDSRRPSQQRELNNHNFQIELARREYERRASQQIELGRPRPGDFARRPSQQIDIGFVPSRAPQAPIPSRSGYEDYRRRPSQQTDIGLPSNKAFMRRPSQQFVTNFEGIRE
ncbi:phosphatidylinositol phosphatase PTPRQ-like isoform X3 [Portunus trituberculatus]|uniref:phosphatidylinositol phosphatase PTPRQ-like isoform X2 n=1 Tax=Portunus trituberculatus TaxID=210409 RepID=UPI001E1CF0FB|nr:phosphatidylinositol phosphatase PTPRQ-like isoform X2 [Portunus trituberculatus]XP_045102735.1 phosphatidylinositol phosphatase PTPRQ-like isoform X3 [Portunus trituberculatus]